MSAGRKLPVAMSAAMVVLACTIFDVALHRLSAWVFDFDYLDNGVPQSVLVKSGVFPVAAFLGFSVMFGFLALVYLRSRPALDPRSLATGLRFFAPIALIMFFGVLESAFVFPSPFRSEIITAAADAVPYVLLGVLLSGVVRPEAGSGVPRVPWQGMLWVALFYVGGRYLLSYPVLHIRSGYIERAAGTFTWTVACGLSMGAFYWLAGPIFSAATPLQKAVRVGGSLGMFWLMIQLFLALIRDVSVADLVVRGVADALYLMAGVYSFERLFLSTRNQGVAA